MTLIPVVGRKTWKMRVVVGALYLVLSLGAVTMVYPFLVMLGQSVTSQYEKADYAIVPRYLRSDTALFGKYAEDKYKGDIGQINAAYGTNYASLTDAVPPASTDPARVRAWNEFASALPARYKLAGFSGAAASFSPSPLLDRYHQFLRERFHGNIRALDRAYSQEDEEFGTVFPPFEQPTKRSWTPDSGVKAQDWTAFPGYSAGQLFCRRRRRSTVSEMAERRSLSRHRRTQRCLGGRRPKISLCFPLTARPRRKSRPAQGLGNIRSYPIAVSRCGCGFVRAACLSDVFNEAQQARPFGVAGPEYSACRRVAAAGLAGLS